MHQFKSLPVEPVLWSSGLGVLVWTWAVAGFLVPVFPPSLDSRCKHTSVQRSVQCRRSSFAAARACTFWSEGSRYKYFDSSCWLPWRTTSSCPICPLWCLSLLHVKIKGNYLPLWCLSIMTYNKRQSWCAQKEEVQGRLFICKYNIWSICGFWLIVMFYCTRLMVSSLLLKHFTY